MPAKASDVCRLCVAFLSVTAVLEFSCGVSSATAQDQSTHSADNPDTKPAPSEETSDPAVEVTVVGTRASLQSAIERKRKAGTVVDSIVAEDVAQFPDKNIGEALQRITGIQLQRDFGEGVAVSIRGVEPDLNRVEINGISVLGNAGGGERRADFRELASELVKSIDVFKGYTANMTEGGIGGTVSITTRRPLELAKPLFSVTASAEYLDTEDSTQPRGNITFADKLFNDRFGFLLNVTYDHVDTRGDFIRDTDWVRLADFDSSTRPTDKTTVNPLYASYDTFASCAAITDNTQRTACQTQFFDNSPRIPRYGIWQRSDKRTSGMATLQYQFTDNLDVWVEGQMNDRSNRLIDNNYSIDLLAASRINGATVVTDANHNVIDLYTAANAPTATTGAGAIFGTSRRDFAYEQNSKYYSTGFNWELSKLKITALGVHSTATTDTESNSLGIAATIPNIRVTLDPSTGVPRFTFPDGVDPQSPATYNAGPSLQYRPEEIETSEDQAKLDFDWETDLPLLKLVKFGAQYREAQSLRYNGGGYTMTNGTVVPSANVTTDVVVGPNTNLSNPLSPVWSLQRLQEFVNAVGFQTSGTFFDNDEVSRDGIPDSWLTPVIGAATDYFDFSRFNHDRVRSANGFPQIPAHNISENISALYLQGNFETEVFQLPVSSNIGVRYTQTKDDAMGSNTIRQRRPNGTGGFTDVTLGVQSITLNNKYDDVLPSFNVSLQIRPDLISRFGYAKVLARPKPTDLVPNSNCLFDLTGSVGDSILDTCTAGNPDLKPYRADQFDLDLGWYPNPDTLLSGALFYKNVKTFILQRTLVRGVDLFKDGVLYDVTQPINGTGSKLRGVELSAQTAFTFLPKALSGFGSVVNYTYSDAKDVGLFNSLTGEELGFPGLSKNSYNIILYYDRSALDVRLAYNSRTSYLQAAADRTGNPLIRDGSAYLDGKITYRFEHPQISLFFEAKNLTAETERATSGDIRLAELSYSGRRYFAGITFKH